MAMETAISMTCQMTARKSPAVASQPLRSTGVVQGTMTTQGLMRPMQVRP